MHHLSDRTTLHIVRNIFDIASNNRKCFLIFQTRPHFAEWYTKWRKFRQKWLKCGPYNLFRCFLQVNFGHIKFRVRRLYFLLIKHHLFLHYFLLFPFRRGDELDLVWAIFSGGIRMARRQSNFLLRTIKRLCGCVWQIDGFMVLNQLFASLFYLDYLNVLTCKVCCDSLVSFLSTLILEVPVFLLIFGPMIFYLNMYIFLKCSFSIDLVLKN